jgi:predicted RecB family nuclease
MSPAVNGLEALHGVGRKRAALLAKAGIGGLEDLVRRDPEAILRDLRRMDLKVTPTALEAMRLHARSYLTGGPVIRGTFPALRPPYLVLDLEYTPYRLIWLIGLLRVEERGVRHLWLWADDAGAERSNLERLADVLGRLDGIPVVTWAGRTADIPQLRSATQRAGLDGLLDRDLARHVDLYARCRRGLRLPMPALGLDQVSGYFGFEKTSPIANGLQALRLFERYENSDDDATRAKLRSALVTYNRDDLDAVVATAEALRDIAGVASPRDST